MGKERNRRRRFKPLVGQPAEEAKLKQVGACPMRREDVRFSMRSGASDARKSAVCDAEMKPVSIVALQGSTGRRGSLFFRLAAVKAAF